MASQSLISLGLLPVVGLPDAGAWPYLLGSVTLHNGYCLFLVMAYRYGDLSHVYPLARGSAPLVVAGLSVVVAGEYLNRQATLSVMLITLGVMRLALTRGVSGIRESRAVLFALATGAFIAGYTVVDGMGARGNGDPHGYTFWLLALHGIPFAVMTAWVHRGRTLSQVRKVWHSGLSAGVISMLAYWIVIWAMTLAPFALVSALRETSVVFAVSFGVVLLKERLDMVRLVAVSTTLIGTVMLRTSR
ncbi:MAG: DMT family transporter [Gammaproteobacteria bacterium]|nr:DMT family transporter [Gammaproteobacteria bacterium]